MSESGHNFPYAGLVSYVRTWGTPDEIRWNPDIAARESEVEGKADMRCSWPER